MFVSQLPQSSRSTFLSEIRRQEQKVNQLLENSQSEVFCNVYFHVFLVTTGEAEHEIVVSTGQRPGSC